MNPPVVRVSPPPFLSFLDTVPVMGIEMACSVLTLSSASRLPADGESIVTMIVRIPAAQTR